MSKYSDFWFDNRKTSILDDFLASDVDDDKPVKKGKDHIALAGHKRAIGNFVRIVSGQNIPVKFPELNLEKSGWINGNSPINIVIPDKEYRYFPFDFKIVFTSNKMESQTITTVKSINDEHNDPIDPNQILLDQHFNFYVEIISILKDSVYEKLDLAVYDLNDNGK